MLNADDTQIHVFYFLRDTMALADCITLRINDVSARMKSNHLQLNAAKTRVLCDVLQVGNSTRFRPLGLCLATTPSNL